MCELVNFVLNCTGCDLQVDVHDIEDPDNVTGKLTDLQDEFQAQNITDYPLISKTRNAGFSRAVMTGFLQSLIELAHTTGLLYRDPALIENIQIWVTTMTSSAIRPFRHTATVLSLAMASSICTTMNEIVENTAKSTRQKEAELKKKKSVNQARLAAFQSQIDENDKRRGLAEGWLRDIFDTVLIHRYRDVDPKIRVDCAMALGTWIIACPDFFFEGQYLRYLGWLLSDPIAATRGEVVKQLSKLYRHKENVGRLRAFTVRFRPRMTEMATRDSEPGIRASVVELLSMIRDIGLLEPDDIDTIGRLIFDMEPRVRKAVSGFFAENINDVVSSTIEELGGDETLYEALGDEPDTDYDTPRKAWLHYKCLAEVLTSYDLAAGEDNAPMLQDTGLDMLAAQPMDSRYMMAAKAIYDGIPEIKEWEILAGYLLYDNSSTLQSSDTDDPQTAFKMRCELSEKEECLLLEILNAAVKQRLIEAIDVEGDRKGKRAKARKSESREVQESTTLHLAQVIPRLLRKFGANPTTASVVLRLEPVLDLEIFQELRHDSTEFASLLDDISKQFLTHGDHNVLTEASAALLHARRFDDLEDVTEAKVQDLWDETTGILRELIQAKVPRIADLANTVYRISNLATISDCVKIFVTESRAHGKSASTKAAIPVTNILLEILQSHDGDDANSNELILSAMKALLFYYLWTTRSIQATIEAKQPLNHIPDYEDFAFAISHVIESRAKLDDVRLAAISTLLDLYTLFATFRYVDATAINTTLIHLIREIPLVTQQAILVSFLAAEKALATKSRKPLEPPADDDPPDDPDSELEDLSDDEEDSDEEEALRRSQHRQQELLLAEKRLCEIAGKMVLAIVGRVMDSSGPTKGTVRNRLIRNKGKLGLNFKEVLGFLEEPKAKRSSKAKGQSKTATKTVTAGVKSKDLVTEQDDEEPAAEEGNEHSGAAVERSKESIEKGGIGE